MDRPRVSIRPALNSDAEQLAALAGQLGYPCEPHEIRERLASMQAGGEHVVFVAVDSRDKVSGWAHGYLRRLLIDDLHVELGGIVVDEARRGLGIGSALLEAVEAWSRDRGARSVFLRSNVIREEAHHFYEGLGYVRTKTQHTFVKHIAPLGTGGSR